MCITNDPAFWLEQWMITIRQQLIMEAGQVNKKNGKFDLENFDFERDDHKMKFPLSLQYLIFLSVLGWLRLTNMVRKYTEKRTPFYLLPNAGKLQVEPC